MADSQSANYNDLRYMARAIKLAQQGIHTTDPNPAVGCVLVKNGQIIAEGHTQPAGCAHAEVDALNKTQEAKGATAYVSLEPCNHHGRTAPCSDALIAAGVSRVVVAMQDPNPLVSGGGLQKLRQAGIVVECGVLQQEAEQLNRGFFKRMTQGLPWITSKLAMSLDGRTAMASGESKWISSEQSRKDVHGYRAASSAILTGIGTVLHDDPQMDARVDFEVLQPVKVVLDSRLQMPLSAKLLKNPAETWIFTCSSDRKKQQQLEGLGAKIQQFDAVRQRLDLLQVFRFLAEKKINSVWVEAGATLNGSLLASELVDEWIFYMASCVLGDDGRGLFHLPGLHQMADKKQLKLIQTRQIGQDLRLTFRSRTT